MLGTQLCCKSFSLGEEHRADLEVLLFQLSGERRSLTLTSHPNTHCVGIFDSGRLMGFAQLFIIRKTTFTTAHLEDVVVHESCRGRGLGTALLDEIIRIAAAEGCKNIALTTRVERHEAYKLFTEKGFREVGNVTLRLTL